ncbi:hypothetical protein [Streptomyces roseolilacinus]|uniref:hypothetical protein n=1 Tax=Streptomyces roseolilacinus TaxID=66904 RepID=UPI001673AFD7|nr:hypothetical protein [Streptomyces roseolilacinus]
MAVDALLPTLLPVDVVTTRPLPEPAVVVALTTTLELPVVWRRRAPLTVRPSRE